MRNVARIEDYEPAVPAASTLGESRPPRINCVLMDDNEFDRKVIRRVAEKSRFELEITETGSIRETRSVLKSRGADILLADYRVPDGDGIRFAGDILRSGVDAPQVIVVTGEGSDTSAIEAIRAGAADYLPKDDINADLFDCAIENALRQHGRVQRPEELTQGTAIAEINGLRELSIRNMHRLKSELLPLLMLGWQASQGRVIVGEERKRIQAEVESKARTIPALVDDLLIAAYAGQADQEPITISVAELIADILADPDGPIGTSCAQVHMGSMPSLHTHPVRFRVLMEAIIRAAIQFCPLSRRPEIELGASRDPAGNPILWMRDNGVPLEVRKNTLGGQLSILDQIDSAGDPFVWSMCQRLAESMGASLKMRPGPEEKTTLMIRFPKELLRS